MPLWRCSKPASALKLLDAGLHVVARDLLARVDGVEVDMVEDLLVRRDHRVRVVAGEVDAEIALGGEHGEPQAPLGDDLLLRAPDGAHLGRRVPAGEDVGDRHVSS